MKLNYSLYSHSFLALAFHGGWRFLTEDSKSAGIRATYQFLCTCSRVFGSGVLMHNLFRSMNDVRQVSFNICVSAIYIGGLLKNVAVFQRNKTLDRLRLDLHEDMLGTFKNEEYMGIHKNYDNTMKKFIFSYYAFVILFGPVWIVSRYFSYFWGPRQLPLPININDLPFNVSTDGDDYLFAFSFLSIVGLIGCLFIAENEVSMFSLYIQVSREYSILKHDLNKISDIFESVDFLKDTDDLHCKTLKTVANQKIIQEKKLRAQELIKRLIRKQLKILGYANTLDKGYRYGVLFQLIAPVIIINAVFISVVSKNVNPDLFFEAGLLIPTLTSMFFACWWAEKVTSQCLEISFVIYSTNWYTMPADLWNDLKFMIMMSQKPPAITVAKVMKLDLQVFLGLLKIMYSCFSLLREIALN